MLTPIQNSWSTCTYKKNFLYAYLLRYLWILCMSYNVYMLLWKSLYTWVALKNRHTSWKIWTSYMSLLISYSKIIISKKKKKKEDCFAHHHLSSSRHWSPILVLRAVNDLSASELEHTNVRVGWPRDTVGE